MTFAAPARLGLLLVVAGLAVSYIVAQRRRPRYAVRFTNLELLDVVAPDRPGFRRHLPALALLASLGAMVLGLARPACAVHPALVPLGSGAAARCVVRAPAGAAA